MKVRKGRIKEKIEKEIDPDKVTIEQFFKTQIKIIKELYTSRKIQTISIIVLSCILMCENFINLKFLEFSTNSVAGYVSDNPKYDFKTISVTFLFFIVALLMMKITQGSYDKIQEKYVSEIVFDSEKKLINKLSKISYEYYESYKIYQTINLARQASGQYADAVFGITQMAQIILMLIVYGVMLSKINILFLSFYFQ